MTLTKSDTFLFLPGLAGTTQPKVLRQKLQAMAKALGHQKFKEKAALEIVRRTRPQMAVPDVYAPYRPLVRDGIQFFLSRIAIRRLVDLIIRQLKMDMASSAQERLLEMAKQFPTLHKLGQIIARNKNIDPAVKKWLIHLEHGHYGTCPQELRKQIQKHLRTNARHADVEVDENILSEASVGAVIGFKWRHSKSKGAEHHVFKVLKPRVKQHLKQELTILEKVAAFFEKNRHRYTLKNFKFKNVFKDIRKNLADEINFLAEQAHLGKASRFYEDMASVRIPRLVPLSNDAMTAMEFIEGSNIANAGLTADERRKCARLLFKAIICKPLFSQCDQAIFHGDPHAGNILAVSDGESRDIKVALLDWSLSDRLAREERVKVIRLIQSILENDPYQISHAVCGLANADHGPEAERMAQSDIQQIVAELMLFKEYAGFPLIKKAFWLLDQISCQGVVFQSNLLFFRKTIFTLEGVLNDLDPLFDMDRYMTQYLGALVIKELPKRMGSTLLLQADNPQNYQSLLSNKDLQVLLFNQYIQYVRQNADPFMQLFEKQAEIMGQWFRWPFLGLFAFR